MVDMKNKVIDYKTKFIIILTVIIVISFIAIAVLSSIVVKNMQESKEPSVSFTSSSIREKISQISELAVDKIEYRDVIRYEEGKIPILTQKACTMIYDAKVKVGIDFSKIDVDVSENDINITLPESEILDIIIDENSLEFYDEKFALFNWQKRADTVELLKYANENVSQKVLESGILNQSKEDAAELIKSVLEPMTENSEININVV